MPFRAILLLLYALSTAALAPLVHSPLATVAASDSVAGKTGADEMPVNQRNGGPEQSLLSRKHSKQDAPTEALIGTVEWEYKPLAWDCDVPNCDHFAFYVDARQTNYELDNARAALPYEGKRAKVTGVVNRKDSIIHVLSIEAVK